MPLPCPLPNTHQHSYRADAPLTGACKVVMTMSCCVDADTEYDAHKGQYEEDEYYEAGKDTRWVGV